MSSRNGNHQNSKNGNSQHNCKLLVLHGNRQTGQLLLGRMDKLRKRLQSVGVHLVAIDAPFPHPDDAALSTWWNRRGDSYEGLQESMELVQTVWESAAAGTAEMEGPFTGLLGFSQGARLVHLLAVQHAVSVSNSFLPGLQFVIMVAGYEAPFPDNFPSVSSSPSSPSLDSLLISVPSLHVWGERDQLITPQQSEAVARHYASPVSHVHEGGHHVPMRAADVRLYVDFVTKYGCATTVTKAAALYTGKEVPVPIPTTEPEPILHQPIILNDASVVPDDETTLQQSEEVEALQAIYPDEFHLISECEMNGDGDTVYVHPIQYRIDLVPSDQGVWPRHTISLHVTYPATYPSDGAPVPILQLLLLPDDDDGDSSNNNNDNNENGAEFSGRQTAACVQAMHAAAEAEQGMPCVMTCILAARDFFESGAMRTDAATPLSLLHGQKEEAVLAYETDETGDDDYDDIPNSTLKAASEQRVRDCNLQGLEIAEKLLSGSSSNGVTSDSKAAEEEDGASAVAGKGGSWLFTIGLVGKPSAGKSTFFNTATGFARQRQTADTKQKPETSEVDSVLLGGATMAPHPFTTINHNVGYALVPAPTGSCPEDDAAASATALNIGSTHGRDSDGRRLVPVLLKDVAGLVPGAYQGRGRGNQFLNDLCDADVLIHVCDASGMADSEGNIVVAETDSREIIMTRNSNGNNGANQTLANGNGNGASHPLQDMAWIRNELIEWVFTNLIRKWDSVRRKGRAKLAGMFSGYGQPQAMTRNVLNAVENYMERELARPLEHLDEWDSGDVHRLVSAFLGVRFPIALALNKMDLPSSQGHIQDIQAALPIHGTHVGTPLSARKEMLFVRRYINAVLRGSSVVTNQNDGESAVVPRGTWRCLQSAINLCEPILVFPVVDHSTYAPLPGLLKYATCDSSLPSPGMIACLQAAGGSAPSEWDSSLNQYTVPKAKNKKAAPASTVALRDAIMMKPGSTVNDVFLTLKRLCAVGGEFVRAEAAGDIGVPAKPVPKHHVLSKKTRILKIMTNKRTAWQNA